MLADRVGIQRGNRRPPWCVLAMAACVQVMCRTRACMHSGAFHSNSKLIICQCMWPPPSRLNARRPTLATRMGSLTQMCAALQTPFLTCPQTLT